MQDELEQLNLIFTLIFAGEMLVKMIGFKWRYFKDAWNTFDMIIVILSIIGLILTAESNSRLGS